MATELDNPYPYFSDRKGDALDEGSIFIGQAGMDPELFPIDLFWDDGLTVPASQPLRTIAGYIVNPGAGNSPGDVYLAEAAYSIRIRDRRDVQVFYDPTAVDRIGALAAPDGATQVGFIQDGADAQPDTLLGKGRQERNLLDWIPQSQRDNAVAGTVDITSWLRNAVADVGVLGGILRIPYGDFQLDSAVVGLGGIELPSNIHIIGQGINRSRFTITGTSECNLFSNLGNSFISIEECSFYGNNVATASGRGAALRNILDVAASDNMTDVLVRRCSFDNFKADNWIETYGESAAFYFSRIIIDGNIATSYSGNARNGASAGVPSAFASFSAGNTTCKIYDCRFSNNIVYGDYIKSACLTWAGVTRFVFENNEAINMALSSEISNDSAAYAFLSYNGFGATNRPLTITYRNNRVSGCRDAGIYATDIDDLIIDGFLCTNQTSTVDGTLPKGCVVLNGTRTAFVSNMRLYGACARGISVASGDGGERWAFSNVDMSDACALGFRSGGVSTAALLEIDGFTCSATTNRAIFFQPTATTGITRFTLRNFDIKASATWAFEVNPTGAPTFALLEISNGRCGDGGIRIPSIASTTSLISLRCITFEDTGRSQSTSLDIQGSKNVSLTDLTFVNDISGQHMNLLNTQGVAAGIQFINCASTKYYLNTSTMCVLTPTWTGQVGQFVQNINTTTSLEQGAVGTKYVLHGWRWQTGTTWTEVRVPTNNNTATA